MLKSSLLTPFHNDKYIHFYNFVEIRKLIQEIEASAHVFLHSLSEAHSLKILNYNDRITSSVIIHRFYRNQKTFSIGNCSSSWKTIGDFLIFCTIHLAPL